MKKLLLFLFVVLSSCATLLRAQELILNTTRFVGGDSSCGYSICEYAISTRDGGILFVGYTDCFAGGGSIPPSPPDTSAEAVPSNILIGKLDSNMNVSWVKVYGGSWIDMAMGAVQTPDGGYAVLSYTQSDDRDVSGNHGSGDLWLVRIDSLGNLLWQQCYGSPYDEQPGAIALAPDNGFIMFGISNGDGDEVPTHYSGSEFDYDWVVIKTDSMGNWQWSKSLGGTGDENGNGSIIAANNAYYLVSSSNSTNYDCVDTCWHPGVNTGYDYYMFKLDSAGNKLWDSSYGGSGGDVVYSALWDSRDSSIVVNGNTTSNDYMVTGNHGGGDFWVIKTDKNGVLKWEECLGGPNNDGGTGITIANTGGYMAYGETYGGGIGYSDNWLFALGDTGSILCNIIFGGSSYEDPYSIISFKNGFAATGGSSSPGFTAGTNLGLLSGDIEDVFISYINYWPLAVTNISTSNQQMAVYPNPSNGMVRIVMPNETGNLTIMNIIGESVFTAIINQNKNYIDINTAGWANGIYIAKWQGENGIVLTNKLIKN